MELIFLYNEVCDCVLFVKFKKMKLLLQSTVGVVSVLASAETMLWERHVSSYRIHPVSGCHVLYIEHKLNVNFH